MQSTNSFSTIQVIEKAIRWLPEVGGFTATIASFPAYEKCMVTFEDLKKVQPYLPDIMFQMQREWSVRSHGDFPLPGNWVYTTLRHWEKPLTITDVNGNSFFVLGLSDIIYAINAPAARLMALTYDIAVYDGDDDFNPNGNHASTPHIEYVNNVESKAIEVTLDYLDTTFPGWQNRWAVLRSMDTHAVDRAAYILQPSVSKPEQLLNNISFD